MGEEALARSYKPQTRRAMRRAFESKSGVKGFSTENVVGGWECGTRFLTKGNKALKGGSEMNRIINKERRRDRGRECSFEL